MTRHRFGGDWRHRKVWAGDLLHARTARERGRGWFHIGQHRIEDGGVSLDELLADFARRPLWLGGRTLMCTVYLPDGPDGVKPTPVELVWTPTECQLSLPVLLGPAGLLSPAELPQ